MSQFKASSRLTTYMDNAIRVGEALLAALKDNKGDLATMTIIGPKMMEFSHQVMKVMGKEVLPVLKEPGFEQAVSTKHTELIQTHLSEAATDVINSIVAQLEENKARRFSI